jgi:hypothetical protein
MGIVYVSFSLDKIDNPQKQRQDDRLAEIHWDTLSLLKIVHEINSRLKLFREREENYWKI